MSLPLDISLSLVSRRTPSTAEALAERVRLVLETQPGQLPYAPDFGCDLAGLLGGTARSSRLAEARLRVTGALERWLPDAVIASCELDLLEDRATPSDERSVPFAEAAMVSGGIAATLEVRVVLETPSGPVALEARLTP